MMCAFSRRLRRYYKLLVLVMIVFLEGMRFGLVEVRSEDD